MNFTIYHNPKCSKSRAALTILQNHGINPIIIEYLKTPLNLEQIRKLRSNFNLNEFIRCNEPIFKKLTLTLDNEEKAIKTILKEPILMQRPIITYGDLAIIGREPEKLIEFINKATKL